MAYVMIIGIMRRSFAFVAACGFVALSGATGSIDDLSLVRLAHQAIRAEVENKPFHAAGQDPPHPVFVTIERAGVVLGCRGDLRTRFPSLQEEVASAARAACAHDPRYRPIAAGDLNRILVTVTVVRRQEPIQDVRGLEPRDGLVLRCGEKTGVVLPWEGKDPSIRLDWAYRKAGVSRSSAVHLFRLVADRTRG